MKSMLKAFYAKPLVIYLVLALLAISTFGGPAEAMFVPAAPHHDPSAAATMPAASPGRAADLVKIQAALESKIIQQKLMDYGLTPEETMARVGKLSDDQIHQLATHTDSLQAGGDAVGLLVALVVLAILVVLLIYLLQGKIVIRK